MSDMITEYSDEDFKRGWDWYVVHKKYVDAIVDEHGSRESFPMSGSDIARPELWKAGAWKWFFEMTRIVTINYSYDDTYSTEKGKS